MADERYYTVTAIFDPSVKAQTTDAWSPVAITGQDPSDMRIRRLVKARVGRFPPDVLGRKAKSTRSLVQVWTDGPVVQGDRYYALGSDDPTEASPPSTIRGDPVPLSTSVRSAGVVVLGPTDHLAIDTQNETTTCYIAVFDLDERQLLQWLANTQLPPVLSVFGRTGHVQAEVGDYNSSQITNTSSVPGATVTAALNAVDADAAAAQATADAHASRHNLMGADSLDLAGIGEWISWTQSSNVWTVPRLLTTTTGVTSGFVYGCLARVLVGGTYSGIRFCQRAAATTANHLRAGVFDSTGTTRLAQTAELAGASGVNALFQEPLDNPLNLAKGDVVILALGFDFTGGSPNFQGRAHNSGLTVNVGGIEFCFRSAAGGITAAGLVLPLTDPGGRNIFPWIELF